MRLLCAAVLAVLLTGSAAHAHGLHVFASGDGDKIRGEAYFRKGSPAKGAKIALYAPDGKRLQETLTDGEGKFVFTVAARAAYKVAVDTGDGHAAEYTLDPEELASGLPVYGAGEAPAGVSTATPAAASTAKAAEPAAPATTVGGGESAETERLLKQVLAKQRQLYDEFEQRREWRDILGGIGYIFGLFGVALYFATRKRRQ